MRKLLIVSHSLEIGGAEKSLLGLLENLTPDIADVDLFLLRHEGELLEYIPSYIHLLPEIPAYTVLARPMTQTIKEGHLLLSAARLIGKAKANRYNQAHNLTDSSVALEYSHKYTRHLMPEIQPDVEYDLAISFLTPHYFVAEKVHAKKKLAWIHTDYSKVSVNAESETAMWGAYDVIASISDHVTESFCSVFPSLRNRVRLIPNMIPRRYMEQQTDAFQVDCEMPDDGSIKLLSIGRFCEAKNFDNVPDLCRRLRESGLNVKWYLIGFGSDEQLVRNKIAETGMQESVIMLGKKENPYPYIKACDLYIQPSRYEGKCVSVIEAQLLHKPVVITNYATAPSQLENGVDGIIVPLENQVCAAGIASVIRDAALQQQLIENTKKRDYTNSDGVQKLFDIMGDHHESA